MAAKIKPSYTEALLTDPQAFGLVTATPLQRAICRVSDGVSIAHLWHHAEVRDAFRGARPPERAPETMAVLSAIRAAKSTIAAAAAVRMTQTIDLTGVIPGDEIRIPVLSVDKDSATATFNKISGMLLARPALSTLLVKEPTTDTVWLRHPGHPCKDHKQIREACPHCVQPGHQVEIKVVALAKYGSTVVSRWLGGIIFDEGPLMAGEESVRNLSEARRAVEGRIRPRGQEWIIGSPWGAVGPVYDLVQEYQGNPDEFVVVARAPGPAMNPGHWTPEYCARLAKKDPKAHRTNVLAEFADPEETQFSSVSVEEAMRDTPEHLPPEVDKGIHYTATLDPATRGNAWTFVITGHYGFGGPGGLSPMLRVAYHYQWRGSGGRPLQPDTVLAEISEKCAEYGLTEAFTDQWAVDALRVIADREGLTLHEVTLNGKNRIDMADELKTMITRKCLELPPSRIMRQDLVGVKKRITVNSYTLALPKTSDGRHCDYVPPLLLLTQAIPEPPEQAERPGPNPYEEFDIPNDEGWAGVFGRLC